MNPFSIFTTAPKTVDNVFDKDNGLLAKAGGWIGNLNFSVFSASAQTGMKAQVSVSGMLTVAV